MSQTAAQVLIQFPPDLPIRLAIIVLIIAVTGVVAKLLSGFVSKTFGRSNPHVARQARRVVSLVSWFTGAVLALSQVPGLELTWLLVMIAIFAVIVVVALRDALANLAARETIYMYNQFKVGDWIQVEKVFGRVTDITWNDTVLSTLNNETVYIPNSAITKSVIINRTTQEGIRISVPLAISSVLNLEEVERALLEIGEELKEELVHESKPEVRLINVGPKATKLELLLRINNPAKSRLVSSEVLKKFAQKTQQKT